MNGTPRVVLGLDYGTESIRAMIVDLVGNEHGSAAVAYPHGQITDRLPGTERILPTAFALQHPGDWLPSAAQAVTTAMQAAGVSPDKVIGIGVDFTSCTVLPTKRDATPLCLLEFASEIAGVEEEVSR